MRPLPIITRNGSDAGAVNFATALDRTHQEFREECDINTIMARYNATGVMPQPWKSPPKPLWGDFSSVPEFQAAQQLLVDARDAFLSLPAKVRARFHNDPAEVLAFVHDPDNLEEARKLGLANPAPPSPAPPVEGK